jgi:uncharacterized protein HemX
MPVDEQEVSVGIQEPPVAQPAEGVSVPVAARRLGRSPDAIRSAIRRGSLSGRRGNDGKWLVFLPAGLAGAIDAVQQDDDNLQQGTDRQAAVVDRLQVELEQERRLSVDRQEAVAELRERVGRLEGEAAGHAALVAELREALAWQRRPWWRRLIG